MTLKDILHISHKRKKVYTMKCPKCKSEHITFSANTVVKTKSRSFLWNLFMIFITCGFWLIWMLIRKRKEKVVTIKTAICQDCGFSWKA